MTKTITVVCEPYERKIYGSIEEARKDYFSEVDEINDPSHDYACECLEHYFSFESLIDAIIEGDRSVFNTIKTDYYNYVSEQNEADFNDWLDNCCIIDDIEVEV